MNQVPIHTSAVAGVAIATIANEIQMLRMKRAREGFWSHISGSIESRENAPEALRREILEETGVVVEELYSAEYIEQFYDVQEHCIRMVPAFVAMLGPDIQVRLNEEHTDYKWCSLDEAKSLAEFPNQRSLYDHVWFNFVENRPSPLSKVQRS